LVTRLEEETRIGKGGTLAAQLSRLDLIVLDELGYLPFARSGGQLLFHLISKLYERTSVIITTNCCATIRVRIADNQDENGGGVSVGTRGEAPRSDRHTAAGVFSSGRALW